MSITSRKILDSAEKFMSVSHCEADYRAVVSRAYYAAYHYALALHESLLLPGHEPPEDVHGVHAQLIYRLINPATSNASKFKSKSIGYILRGLKVSRVQADYTLDDQVTYQKAEECIKTVAKMHMPDTPPKN